MSNISLLITAAILSTIPMPFLKMYNTNDDYKCVVIAILSQIILVYIYLLILKNSKMSTIYPFIKILSIIMVMLIGIYFYKEPCNIENKLGVLFGIISLYLLSK
jgi:multidrug transporter EmrE-like cation transporter